MAFTHNYNVNPLLTSVTSYYAGYGNAHRATEAQQVPLDMAARGKVFDAASNAVGGGFEAAGKRRALQAQQAQVQQEMYGATEAELRAQYDADYAAGFVK